MVGREKEKQELLDLLHSNESEFCVVYGRRRVGKTYLIKNVFASQFTFYHAGLANATKEEQLSEFRESLRKAGMKKGSTPRTWNAAFHQLEAFLEAREETRKVIFIDELPWLDTQKSRFLSAFEHFWNGWAAMRNDIFLIVCGSATSWIISNVLNNHGGLHNRVTHQIHLQPFSLYECEQYALSRGIQLTRKDLIEAYMAMGGIPYYWHYLQRGESLAQNIDRMFFAKNAPLRNEYDELYRSLFSKPQVYMDIVAALSIKKRGLLRDEILSLTGALDNEIFQRVLRELEQCGFIRKYVMMGRKTKDSLYQLVDNFTLFHFAFLAQKNQDEHFWTNNIQSPAHSAWAGLAFERVCLWHIKQIKMALGISGVATAEYSWTHKSKEGRGFQIDLLLDRKDGIINICEMKYADATFAVDAALYDGLVERVARFRELSKTRKAVHLTLITTHGVSDNKYQYVFQNVIPADLLFAQ